MKYLLLLAIRIYWLIPKSSRRRCIFKCNCSRYVYNITRKKGLVAGIKALSKRFRQCRNGFAFLKTGTIQWVILDDQTSIRRARTVL